jgi:hypothetical protein
VNLAESYTSPGDPASRSWLVKARGQYWDLRREGKLSPSVAKLLAEVEDGIAKVDEGSGER